MKAIVVVYFYITTLSFYFLLFIQKLEAIWFYGKCFTSHLRRLCFLHQNPFFLTRHLTELHVKLSVFQKHKFRVQYAVNPKDWNIDKTLR